MGTDLLLELTRRHLEPHRHYHTLERIAAMLHEGRRFPLDQEQTLAIWFHDALLDPTSDQNHRRSARLAASRLVDAGFEHDAVDRICRMVLDLRGSAPSSPQAAPVVDLDQMALAVPWPLFEHNTLLLRAEHDHLSDEQFMRQRLGWYERLLAREQLFFTAWGRTLEAAARHNMQRALAAADVTAKQ